MGTQSPNEENLIYLFEYKDDNNNLAKVSFKFPFGECWHLASSSKYPNLFSAITSQKGNFKASLFKLPPELENPIEDDFGYLPESPIEKAFDLIGEDGNNLTRQCHWHPDDGDHLLTSNNGILQFWDVNEGKEVQEFSILSALERTGGSDPPLGPKKHTQVTDLRWSSLFNCSVVAAAVGPKIYGIDTRIPDHSPSSVCWLITDQRCNRIRSIDFNPNSQYYLASGGDDCRANFWDLRQLSKPAVHLETHTHWIWSIRYNPFHDQLILSAGSDARVALMRLQSIASEPFGKMADYDLDEVDSQADGGEDLDCDGIDQRKQESLEDDKRQDDNQALVDHDGPNATKSSPKQETAKQLGDEVIKVYEEHDDSVYAAEWATDPWIFASVGFESRLVINRVPKAEKFNILF